jgi:hypothetical protein
MLNVSRTRCHEPWLGSRSLAVGGPQVRLASVSADLTAFVGIVKSFALVSWRPPEHWLSNC